MAPSFATVKPCAPWGVFTMQALLELQNVRFEVRNMHEERLGRGTKRTEVAIVLVMGLLIPIGGCHASAPDRGSSEPAMQAGRVDTAQASTKKIATAGVAIVSACAKVPFANAGKGLIVAETGLHEDVFDLRDRASYQAVPFGLYEAQRLETLLQKEAGAPGHSQYPAEQADCIRQFADHLQTLTDPLVEADTEQKQLDLSAFNKASKEAAQETEQEEKSMESHSGRQ